MIVAVHQPNYLPYLGIFQKMARADVFVLYDTAQYSKNEFHNRNRIKTRTGPQWLTVPVRRPSFRPILEVEIANERAWAANHLKSIQSNYAHAPYCDTFAPEIRRVLTQDWKQLVDLNVELIELFATWLSIDTKLVRASALPDPATGDPTEKLLHYTQVVGGDVYLSGSGGRNYLDTTRFQRVRLEFAEFVPKPYPQQHGKFIPNLSIVDVLMNCGETAQSQLE